MKRQIRRGVFETNSSSTHSLTMCSEEEFSEESEDEGERERDAAALKELVKEEPNEELSGVGDSSDEQTDEMSESRRKRVCLFCVCYSGN